MLYKGQRFRARYTTCSAGDLPAGKSTFQCSRLDTQNPLFQYGRARTNGSIMFLQPTMKPSRLLSSALFRFGFAPTSQIDDITLDLEAIRHMITSTDGGANLGLGGHEIYFHAFTSLI